MSTPTVDTFVDRLPDQQLSGFDRLPAGEQGWRARIYWVTYVWTGSAPFSWTVAMSRDPTEVAEMREFLASTPDAWIAEGMDHLDESHR